MALDEKRVIPVIDSTARAGESRRRKRVVSGGSGERSEVSRAWHRRSGPDAHCESRVKTFLTEQRNICATR